MMSIVLSVVSLFIGLFFQNIAGKSSFGQTACDIFTIVWYVISLICLLNFLFFTY